VQRTSSDASVLIVQNAWQDGVEFTLPEALDAQGWTLLLDTATASRESLPLFDSGAKYVVTGRSLLVLAALPDANAAAALGELAAELVD